MRNRGQAFFIILLLLLPLSATHVAAQQGVIVLDETRHDFGTIKEGVTARHVFSFTNTGDAPFKLTAVRPSCGCTTPEWTADAVAPGGHGKIAVEFDSEGRPGPFEKSILVESTADPDRVILYIEGTVEPSSLAAGDTLGSLVFDGAGAALPSIPFGEPLAHSITIKNAGERPIKITEARSDADFVRVELPGDYIFPGDIAEIHVAFVTSDMRRGPFSHRIDLVTTDEKLPIKEIRLTGMVK